ncbi:MAG: hypothetical protein BGO16_16810 [Nitrobacter sp. 62-23]|nr:MAG: hypothetical protein BGO16_16810 [Nitrobacter sp. 62-23]
MRVIARLWRRGGTRPGGSRPAEVRIPDAAERLSNAALIRDHPAMVPTPQRATTLTLAPHCIRDIALTSVRSNDPNETFRLIILIA